jgi:hypothetical protein
VRSPELFPFGASESDQCSAGHRLMVVVRDTAAGRKLFLK